MRQFKTYKDIILLANEQKFVVTATINGKHNVGSKHYRGLAADVRTRDKTVQEVESFIKLCRSFGLIVRDERVRPKSQKVWSGSHLHIEIA